MALREHCHGAQVIIVAVTGSTLDRDKGRAWACEFDLYVAKPMSIETLRELLALLDPAAPVHACDGLDETDLRDFKGLLYPAVPKQNAARWLLSEAG